LKIRYVSMRRELKGLMLPQFSISLRADEEMIEGSKYMPALFLY